MQLGIFKQVNSFNPANYEAAKKFADINARAFERLVQKQFALASLCLEDSVKQLQLMKGNQDLNSFAANQSDTNRQCADKVHNVAKETIEILVETRGEFDTWVKQALSEIIPSTSK